MKKLFVCLIIIALIIVGFFVFKNENKSSLKKIKVAEVTHSIFYAPMYVSDALGYFEEEGLDVDIILTAGEI